MRIPSLIIVALATVSSTSAQVESLKRTSIQRVAERRSKQLLNRQAGSKSLVLETVVQATPAPVDGTTHVWEAGDWSDCSADCGPGVQQRTVLCMNNDTMSGVPDGDCFADALLRGSEKPATDRECQGLCIRCDDRNELFTSVGLTNPPPLPVPSRTGRVCRVTDPRFTCCDHRVENTIVTQVVAIQKGFKAIPAAASEQAASTIGFIANSTNEFTERLADTQAQLTSLTALLADPASLLLDKHINRALTIVSDVLTQRVADLQEAIDNSTVIVDLIESQLSVYIDDGSLSNDSRQMSGYNASTTRKPVLADCVDATVNLFAAMSCAACNPSFVEDNVDTHAGGLFKSVNVSTSVCQTVFKQCVPTVRDSRRHLREALNVMRSIQSKLAQAAVRLQPALLALWNSIAFNWLPGATRPIGDYVPDITSLDCIRSTDTYVLPPATQVADFCANFFANWNYQFTIQSMLKDVSIGTRAMDSLQRCDKCFHLVITRVGQILSDGKGGIDVTLALSPSALAEAGCAGLSTSPAKSAAASIRDQLLSGSINFFAIKQGDVYTPGERGALMRKSRRAMAFILSASRDALNNNDKTKMALDSPVVYIHKLQYTDDGLDPAVLSNVSWSIISNASRNPPPSIWDARHSDEVGIIATDINCTSHAACNTDGGDAPYWFCANVRVCNGTIPCDDNERELLNVGPKCVKGICVDGFTAVDGVCPDIAICPATKTGKFDHTYFSKFKSIAPLTPPSSDLVNSEGPAMADAITQALNYASGVCDCAFAQRLDEKGLVSLVVGDQCKYAQCLAYAIANEDHAACQAGLAFNCAALQSACPNVVCDAVGAQWNIPTCDVKAGGQSGGFALASDTRDAPSGVLSLAVAVMIILAAVVM